MKTRAPVIAVVLAAAGCSTTQASMTSADAGASRPSTGAAEAGRGAESAVAGRDASPEANGQAVDGGLARNGDADAQSIEDAPSSANDGASATDAPGRATDASAMAETGSDASDAGPAAAPGVVYVGRFDTTDPAGPRMAWPGTRIVARFDGTGASVQLTQSDGYSGGPSWFDVVVDGNAAAPFSVAGVGEVVSVTSGLAPGAHVVEIEKRTEANLGTVRFEGFTFTGGAGLLAPPAPVGRRVEFLGDSTIDGFGALGDIATTCPTGDPPQYNDSRSSLAFFTASALGADMVLSAYSGKGLTVNEAPGDTEYFGVLYPRAIPDSAASIWTFQAEIPDAVVIALGGVDMDGQSTAPPGFQEAYDSLVGTVRGHYPGAAIWLTVWSQITDEVTPTRTAMTATLQSIVSARSAAGDSKLYLYVFPEATPADETGCEGHATVAHEQAMAALMTAQIKQVLGW